MKSRLKQKFAAIERERKSRLVLLAVYSVRSAHYAHLYYKRRVLSISSVVLKVPRFKIGTDENSRNVRGVFSHNQPSSCHIRRWGGNDNVSRFSFSVKIRLARPHALVNLLRLQRTRYSAMFRPIVRRVCLRVERTVVYTTVHTQSHVWFIYFSGNRWMTCSGFGKTPWFFAYHPTEARTSPPTITNDETHEIIDSVRALRVTYIYEQSMYIKLNNTDICVYTCQTVVCYVIPLKRSTRFDTRFVGGFTCTEVNVIVIFR